MVIIAGFRACTHDGDATEQALVSEPKTFTYLALESCSTMGGRSYGRRCPIPPNGMEKIETARSSLIYASNLAHFP